MSDVFNTLGSVLTQQFGLGDSKLKSLNVTRDGQTIPYGRLGDFANKFDQSAERNYVEEGFYKTDLYNPQNKQMEIWLQQPEVTILVKKRAFSSLAENYQTNLLSDNERAFVRATKYLFQNKCKQIAAYEKLTKISNLATDMGSLDYHLLPVLFSATNILDTGSALNAFGSSTVFQKFKGVVDRVRTITNLSQESVYTGWVTNDLGVTGPDIEQSTGVIEFTTGFSISTTSSTNFGKGNCSISFADPYGLMRVTSNDIEQAIADANNTAFSSAFFQLTTETLNASINADKASLNSKRAARGANPITFVINPNAFLGDRIRAIVENSGTEIKFSSSNDFTALNGNPLALGSFFGVSIDPGYLTADNQPAAKSNQSTFTDALILGSDGLNRAETQLFSNIVKSTNNQLQINANSRQTTKAHNAKNNDLRRKMRLHYGSKLIIQPMDVLHVFVNSHTQMDDKVLGGLQSSLNGLDFLQQANTALTNIKDYLNAGADTSLEKTLFVGADFPTWLWLLIRNQFVGAKTGTQIFAGIVESTQGGYGEGGKQSISITAKDNCAYFDFGVVNIKPALNVWNGSLYDPITPFDIKFDTATGLQKDAVPDLLPENAQLFKSTFIKYKSGVYVGKRPNIDNFVQDAESIQNNSTRRVFYDPDGMVYKWKEGIGALVMFGSNYQETPTSNPSVPPQTANPFAGQDAMNVLSLLITGEPYNFVTFYKAALNFDNYGRDVQTGLDPSTSYFKNLQTDLKKRNLLYGNFVPFKRISVDQDTYKNTLNNQIRASSLDSELSDLLAQRAEMQDRIAYLTNFGKGTTPEAKDLESKVDNLDNIIQGKKNNINNELNQIKKPISLIGNDITFDYGEDKNELHKTKEKNQDLRRRLNYLTKRFSWKVKANEDVNFFIVDDSYDKDYDLQLFEKSFVGNMDLFNSQYVTVQEQITTVCQYLDLEIFADTQGHIRVRAPQYNKVPSSVFYRMLRLKNEFDIQIYPQFLENLYVDQVNGDLSRIETLEDEIRMFGLALGKSTDRDIENYLSTSSPVITVNLSSTPFKFITNEGTGKVSRLALPDFLQNSDPQKGLRDFQSSLDSLQSVSTQATINNIASTSTRDNLLTASTESFNNMTVNAILSSNTTQNRQDLINQRLEQETGQRFDLKQLFPTSSSLLGGKISQADLLKVLDDITSRISERQRLLKTAAAALKNAKEGLSFVKTNSVTGTGLANKLLVGNIGQSNKVPAGFENLIQDEGYDDYGPGSGKRFTIRPSQIRHLTLQEHAPEHTSVEVVGGFADNFIPNSNLPAALKGNGAPGGNALTSAHAVDYDMWRMYGNRKPASISAPFLTNPETQCAPFAVALLNQGRKKIYSGSTVTIIGNEYMQAGEVIYLEEQDMLFYVESVQHSIQYGGTFSTTLNITYGHMPGEYIPTYLDTVGKILYKNKDITNFVSKRHDNVLNSEHLGTIVGDVFGDVVPNGSAKESIMNGRYKDQNRAVLDQIMQSANSVFSASADDNYVPVLELRIYSDSESDNFEVVDPGAQSLANAVKEALSGNNNLFELAKLPQPTRFFSNESQSGQIRVQPVNASNKDEFRSPSSHCYGLARTALFKGPRGGIDPTQSVDKFISTINQIDKFIYKYMVDCWIHFEFNIF